MTVEVGTGEHESRFLKRDWPIEEGLIAGSTKQEGTKTFLESEEGSIVPERTKAGI